MSFLAPLKWPVYLVLNRASQFTCVRETDRRRAAGSVQPLQAHTLTHTHASTHTRTHARDPGSGEKRLVNDPGIN